MAARWRSMASQSRPRASEGSARQTLFTSRSVLRLMLQKEPPADDSERAIKG